MDWHSFYLPLLQPKHLEAEVSLRSIGSGMLISVVVSLIVLFAVGVAFDPGQVEQIDQVRKPAISSAVPGPYSHSCSYVRWCSKPVHRNYLFEYPLVGVEGEEQSV